MSDFDIVWHLEKRKIKDLKPHPRNPRKLSKHDGENLEKSLKEDGIIDKPSIDLHNQIIGGHQRLQILKKMGHKEVDVWVPNRQLSDAEINRINLRLNRISGEWDYEILANEWSDEELLEGGFTEEEIHAEELSGDEESANEPEKNKKTCPACGHEF